MPSDNEGVPKRRLVLIKHIFLRKVKIVGN